MDQRLHQIRLVTERYRDLQGLRLAWGGFMFAVFGSVLFLTGWTRDLEVLAVLFTMAACIAPGEWLLGRYYRRAFGRLVSVERDKVLFWPAMAICVGAAIA